MTVLGDAIEAANARKVAAGLPDQVPESGDAVVFSENETADRAIFSGFDIDHDELLAVTASAAVFLVEQACNSHPLIPLFRAAWVDGFLAGLMVQNNVAPHHVPPGPERDGPGGITQGWDT